METHRCQESLKHRVSIRKHEQDPQFGWQIGSLLLDHEWGYLYMDYGPSNVKFCPYCGKKLEE
jgi:hypothetical protein